VPLWLLFRHHDSAALRICTVAVPLVMLAAMAFVRKSMLKRLLRQHVKTHVIW
jgi:hypothetical protein